MWDDLVAVGSAHDDFEGLHSAREDLAAGATGLAPDDLEGADSVSDDLAAAVGVGGFDKLGVPSRRCGESTTGQGSCFSVSK